MYKKGYDNAMFAKKQERYKEAHSNIYACDFETYVPEGLTIEEVKEHMPETYVWSSCIVPVGFLPEEAEALSDAEPFIFHNWNETVEWFVNNDISPLCYFHNLKFDGYFIMDWLLKKGFKYTKELKYNGQFRCLISELGMWYSISFIYKNHQFDIYDSLKLIPMSLKSAGKGMKTKHQKLEMEYKGEKNIDKASQKEIDYIKNDVLVLKECLEFMFSQGHSSLTIGGCCLTEFKKGYTEEQYEAMMPNLAKKKCVQGYTIDEWIRRSYHGGWCYVNPSIACKNLMCNGGVIDVNSLYPSVMHSMSGNRYPIGYPKWYQGFIPEEAKHEDKYYFVQFRCSFNIKKGYLPTIQIKNDVRFKSNEWLTTSLNETSNNEVEFVMTQTDYELFHEHYNVFNERIINTAVFETTIALFDKYLDKYKKIKMTSKGALRLLSKLMQNNLYGKTSTSTDSSYCVPFLKEDGSIGMQVIKEAKKKPGYIPIGSAITSYARKFTIDVAQQNYDKFCYADTDSIHFIGNIKDIKGAKLDPAEYCCWKHEHTWDKATFVRQKTYVEHQIEEDGVPVEEIFDNEKGEYKKSYYDIKCCGMPQASKKIVEKNIIEKGLGYFRPGKVNVSGKLIPKKVKGGVILVDSTFTMK